MTPHPHVELSADGTPMVAGARVPVTRLFAWHRQGTTVETLVRRYPTLGWAKVLSALAFAYDNVELVEAEMKRERERVEKERKNDG